MEKKTHKLKNVPDHVFGPLFMNPRIPVGRIAKALGCTKRGVYYHAKARGFSKPDRVVNRSKSCPSEFSDLWDAGVRAQDIAEYFGYADPKHVTQRRKQLGLKPRSPAQKTCISKAEFLEMKIAQKMREHAI